MAEVLLEILKQITIFMIIGKVILNLGMGRGYEKYTRMVIGFMVIVQFWVGINSVRDSLREYKLYESNKNFYSSWKREMKEFEEDLRRRQIEIENTWKEYGSTVEEESSYDKNNSIKVEKIIIGEEKEE